MACDSAEWNGNFYTISGTYTDTLQDIYGADSIVTMDLIINNSVSVTDSLVDCDTVIWNGIPYTASGIYTQTFLTTQGCDSIVTMYITIHNTLSTFEVVCM